MEEAKQKKSIFDNPLLSTKIKSANAKIFPEGGLGYFIGPTLALLSNSVLSTYLNQYMTDVLDMNTWAPTFLTLLPIISVIFIILGNVLVGRAMDHMHTRAGKARPLLLLAIPLSILAFLVLFIISPAPKDGTYVLVAILFAIGYNLWYAIAYPFYYTSHAALVGLSTRVSKDRSLLATLSNATNLAAVGLCTMILPFFVGILFVKDETGLINQELSMNAWRVFAIALIIVNFIGIICEYYFTRERITEESFKAGAVAKKKSASLKEQAKVCFKDKYWVIMILFFFLYQLGGMMKNTSQFYFAQSWFADANGAFSKDTGGFYSGQLAIYGAIPTAIGMVIAWPLSNKIGKGKAIMLGAFLSAIGGAIGFIAPDNFIVVTASFMIKALGSTPAMYLSIALLADIMDHQEAQHGIRTDGLSMTIYGAIMAGMTGIATGILNIALSAVHYSPSMIPAPTPELKQAMLWIFIGGETICYGLIAVIFIFMGVEKFSKFDHKAIVLDQKLAAEAAGEAYIDPDEKLRLEEEQAERDADEARKAALKAKCEKKGLDYEAEEAKYEAAEAAKKEAADKKKAEADAKKAAAEQAKADKLAAMSESERAALEAKAAEKARKEAERDAATLAEFNKLREANGRPAISLD